MEQREKADKTENERAEEYQWLYERIGAEDKEVRLLRGYGSSPIVVVPDKIAGCPVTEIGEYCFASAEHLPAEYGTEGSLDVNQSDRVRVLCGDYLEEVTLPETVYVLHNCAFYNCRNLKSMEFGRGLAEIGNGVFMNCMQLKKLYLRSGMTESSGLFRVLSRIPSELEVSFGEEGRLLYPEYFETYDEIAPAHIFGRNIEGEGFRARQCFVDGIVDYSMYDSIFPKLRAEETALVSVRFAALRLCYPCGLQQQYQQVYDRYVREQMGEYRSFLVEEREQEMLHFLCREQYLTGVQLEEALAECIRTNWSEGTASLMEWKVQYQSGGKKRESRYDFDEW